MADTNPGNFANRPKEEVQAIASMGGKASHGKASTLPLLLSIGTVTDLPQQTEHAKDEAAKQETKEDSPVKDTPNGNEIRNPDGTFKKGHPSLAAESHTAEKEDTHPGRRDDGTFLPGSEAAKDAGHKGGEAAHAAAGATK